MKKYILELFFINNWFRKNKKNIFFTHKKTWKIKLKNEIKLNFYKEIAAKNIRKNGEIKKNIKKKWY